MNCDRFNASAGERAIYIRIHHQFKNPIRLRFKFRFDYREPDDICNCHVGMETDEVFLDMIQSAAHDPDRRLIYADWLAEQGDVRADFLHLEMKLEAEQRPTKVAYLTSLLVQLSRKVNNPAWIRRVTENRASQLTLIFRKSSRRRLERIRRSKRHQ